MFLLSAAIWIGSMGLLFVPMAYGILRGTASATSGQPGSVYPFVGVLLFIVSFATVGALLSWKRPTNPIGWLLSGGGAIYAVATSATVLGAGRWTDWLGSWLWGLGIGLAGTFLLLLFPTGSLLSPRWRPVAWLAAIGLGTFVLGNLFAPGRISGSRFVNPVGVGGALGPLLKVMRGGFALVLVAAIASIVSIGVRYRRSRDLDCGPGSDHGVARIGRPGHQRHQRGHVVRLRLHPSGSRRRGPAVPPLRHRRRHQ